MKRTSVPTTRSGCSRLCAGRILWAARATARRFARPRRCRSTPADRRPAAPRAAYSGSDPRSLRRGAQISEASGAREPLWAIVRKNGKLNRKSPLGTGSRSWSGTGEAATSCVVRGGERDKRFLGGRGVSNLCRPWPPQPHRAHAQIFFLIPGALIKSS